MTESSFRRGHHVFNKRIEQRYASAIAVVNNTKFNAVATYRTNTVPSTLSSVYGCQIGSAAFELLLSMQLLKLSASGYFRSCAPATAYCMTVMHIAAMMPDVARIG
uniref:Transposase n=1 Tax=Panagrellus redivivus TaxID=6233 RepID=A0A7E4ZSB8_PANRE